jgi:hypothetical protein
VTYDKPVFALETYSFTPIKDPDRSLSGVVEDKCIQERKMIGLVARWGHNTLLIGLALMTCVIFFALFK